MMKTVLITDTHKPLGFKLLKSFLQTGSNVIAAPSGEPEGETRKNAYENLKKKPLAVVSWNRSSPLSSKNIILQGLNKFNSLDAALILVPPLPPSAPLAEIKYLDLEIVLDVWLKGSILLARDLFAHFFDQRGGALCFVNLSHPHSNGTTLLDDLCRESMVLVTHHLARAAKERNVKVNAFLSRTTDVGSYADFIVKKITETCNKHNDRLFYFQWR